MGSGGWSVDIDEHKNSKKQFLTDQLVKEAPGIAMHQPRCKLEAQNISKSKAFVYYLLF